MVMPMIKSRDNLGFIVLDDIAEKMTETLHISKSIAISMFPYLEIMFQNDELAWEISDFLGLEDNEIKRFRKKKIPKKVIDKMEKQKAQMRVEERDRRAEELKNQMANVVVETEQDDSLPFEIPGLEDNTLEVEEEIVEEEISEESEEKKEDKKKTDKQVSLFSF